MQAFALFFKYIDDLCVWVLLDNFMEKCGNMLLQMLLLMIQIIRNIIIIISFHFQIFKYMLSSCCGLCVANKHQWKHLHLSQCKVKLI